MISEQRSGLAGARCRGYCTPMPSLACVNGDDACAPVDATEQNWGTVNAAPLLVKGDKQQATILQPDGPAISSATGWMTILTAEGWLKEVAVDGDITEANNRLNAGEQDWLILPSPTGHTYTPCPTVAPQVCERDVLTFGITNRNYQPELDFSEFFAPGYMGPNFGDMRWQLRDLNGTVYFSNMLVSADGTLQNAPDNSFWDASRHTFMSPFPYEGYMALMIGCHDAETGTTTFFTPEQAYTDIHDVYIAGGGTNFHEPTNYQIDDGMPRFTSGGATHVESAGTVEITDSILRPDSGEVFLEADVFIDAPIIGVYEGFCDNADAWEATINDLSIRFFDGAECDLFLSLTVELLLIEMDESYCDNSTSASITDATMRMFSGSASYSASPSIADRTMRFSFGGSVLNQTDVDINDRTIHPFETAVDNSITADYSLRLIRFEDWEGASASLSTTADIA